MKHIEVQHLWLQQMNAKGRLEVLKIKREENVADMFTHSWSAAEGKKFHEKLGVEFADTTEG